MIPSMTPDAVTRFFFWSPRLVTSASELVQGTNFSFLQPTQFIKGPRGMGHVNTTMLT